MWGETGGAYLNDEKCVSLEWFENANATCMNYGTCCDTDSWISCARMQDGKYSKDGTGFF